MDKTKKYFKMCEEAFKDIGIIDDGLTPSSLEKIPNLWGFVLKDGSYCRITQAVIPERGWFQVYYQDQLQDKMEFSFSVLFETFWDGFFEWGQMNWKRFSFCKSFEQLWLAFVMEQEFLKTWNNKKGKWGVKNCDKS